MSVTIQFVEEVVPEGAGRRPGPAGAGGPARAVGGVGVVVGRRPRVQGPLLVRFVRFPGTLHEPFY